MKIYEFGTVKSVYDNAAGSFDHDIVMDAYVKLSNLRDHIVSIKEELEERYNSSVQLMTARQKIASCAKLFCFLYICLIALVFVSIYKVKMTIEPGLGKVVVAFLLAMAITLCSGLAIYFLSLLVDAPKLRYWFYVPSVLIVLLTILLVTGTVAMAIRDWSLISSPGLIVVVVAGMVLTSFARSSFLVVERVYDQKESCATQIRELEAYIQKLNERYNSLFRISPFIKHESWQD
jgi:hypothetical protein